MLLPERLPIRERFFKREGAMKTLLEGKAFVYGKNVDTDQIYPAPLLTITDADKVG